MSDKRGTHFDVDSLRICINMRSPLVSHRRSSVVLNDGVDSGILWMCAASSHFHFRLIGFSDSESESAVGGTRAADLYIDQ